MSTGAIRASPTSKRGSPRLPSVGRGRDDAALARVGRAVYAEAARRPAARRRVARTRREATARTLVGRVAARTSRVRRVVVVAARAVLPRSHRTTIRCIGTGVGWRTAAASRSPTSVRRARADHLGDVYVRFDGIVRQRPGGGADGNGDGTLGPVAGVGERAGGASRSARVGAHAVRTGVLPPTALASPFGFGGSRGHPATLDARW
jgi:hypothetical protein